MHELDYVFNQKDRRVGRGDRKILKNGFIAVTFKKQNGGITRTQISS